METFGMQVLEGLSERQLGLIRFCKIYRELGAGELLFAEGDPSQTMYIVISGSIIVFRQRFDSDTVIAELGAGEILGEIGAITGSPRTAAARANGPTVLMELSKEALSGISEACGAEGSLKLMENITYILSDRLNTQNLRLDAPPKAISAGWLEIEANEALDTIMKFLPHQVFSSKVHIKKLKPEEILCNEKEKPDAFFFVHAGTLHVFKDNGNGRPHTTLSILEAPTLIGFSSLFDGKPRTASVKAIDDVDYTRYPFSVYTKLKKEKPEDALKLLNAMARLLIYWIARG